MKIKIKETNEIKELYYEMGSEDVASDIISIAGAQNDGQFEYSDQDEVFIATQETWEWWKQYFDWQRLTDTEVEELAESLDLDPLELHSKIGKEMGTDYSDHRFEQLKALLPYKLKLRNKKINTAVNEFFGTSRKCWVKESYWEFWGNESSTADGYRFSKKEIIEAIKDNFANGDFEDIDEAIEKTLNDLTFIKPE